MEMWKLTDSTGVYVKPQKHPMRTHFLGNWCGLALFVDLDKSQNCDAAAIRELEQHLGRGLPKAFANLNREGQ